MNNPWEEISLDDYENHMSLESVNQLQTMNSMMKEQFEAYPVETAMVLGIAGGNGLEHVRLDKYRTVYGIDINTDYLYEIPGRYPQLSGVLQCMHLDIVNEAERLPHAEIVIANLLIEYIGYTAFQKAIKQISPKYVSCVIQINTDENRWVSDSPYLHAFDGLDKIHHQMDEAVLTDTMKEIGYSFLLKEEHDLPNGKALVRLDYQNAEMRMVLYDRAYKQQVFDFTKECFDELGKSFEPDGRHSFYNDIENKFIAFYVSLKDDTVIGTVALKKFDHDTAELKSLYLRKEYRGRGYGKQLLDTVIKKARKESFRYIVLDSMSKYKAALGLYESIGFVPIDRYNDNTYADIFMRLEL